MEPMVLLNICWHYLNVPMNSVHVAKFIAKKEKNANVRCVTFTSDVCNNRNTKICLYLKKACFKTSFKQTAGLSFS